MPYCHKCGSEVNEKNSFCPKCGAALKAGSPSQPMSPERYRNEKAEKQEKQEKHEKDEKTEKGGAQQEKYEKHEYGFLGPLIGGVVLILVGFMLYLAVSGSFSFRSIFPFFLIIIGAIVILGVLVGSVMAKRRNPRP
jgi:F0F1-type ATP synthase assembly protein I